MENQSETHDFSNDSVRVVVHHKPKCRVELEVEVKPSLVHTAHKKAIRSLSKEISVPGFRKGKAPDEVVIKKYPQDLDKAWQEMIADVAFRESISLCKVPLLSKDTKITFKMQSHSMDGAKLFLTFDTQPKLPTINPKEIQLKEVPRPEVNDEKVEETIRQVQLFFAEWKEIKDRPVKEGDYVLLDVDVIDEEPPVRLFSNTRFEATKKSMAEWMRKLVIGMNVGDQKEGVSVPDEDAKAEDKAALKPKKVRLVLKTIEEALPPPVDDAFAVKLGVANLEDLRASLLKHLNKQADAHVQEKLREQLNEALLNQFPFELPNTLIEKETQFRMKQLAEDAHFKKEWEAMKEDDRRKMVESIYTQSEKAVRLFYLCRKIIADAKLTITADDMPKAPTNMLEALMIPQPNYHAHDHSEVRQAETYSRLVLEKAEDYLISQATIAAASV
ncbi:MAG: trigger factor [Chlamydiales bacterium]|nr:trigger factor [Chlamydiales bacterium]